MKRQTIIDLFSGAGGLTEGFRNRHYDIVGHVEMNSAACETLRLRDAFYWLKDHHMLARYREFLNGDISRENLLSCVDSHTLNKTMNVQLDDTTLDAVFNSFDRRLDGKSVDGVIGGPPCQAYSTIGRARNAPKKANDTRIYLYRYYIDFLRRYQPKFFVFENVKGLKSFRDSDGTLLLPKMIKEFKQANYRLNYRTINMNEYGVPQTRERVIIFGVPENSKQNIDKFFNELAKRREESLTVGETFSDLPKIKAGQHSDKYQGIPSEFIKKNYRYIHDIPLTQNISRPNRPIDLEIYKQVVLAKQQGKNLKYNDLPKKLQMHKHTNIFLDRFKALSSDKPSHTVVAHIAKDGHHYIHPDIKQNRSITVREAARLQGFPDDYFFETSRTQAFLQIGNAVPPIFSRKIADAIMNIPLTTPQFSSKKQG